MKPETLRDCLWEGLHAAREALYPFHDEHLEPSENDARGELLELFVKCRESIQSDHPASEPFEAFATKNRDTVEVWLDDYYLYQAFYAVTGMVERTLLLARFATTSTPSDQTNLYISEASKCYIRGFMLAAVALARSALEQSLKERLREEAYQDCNLGQALKAVKRKGGILSAASMTIAWDLNRKCNAVMHNRPMKSENEALHIFDGVRELIREIYSGMTVY